MEIAGYIASALIGISLGLIGGGGSILTVPVLVFLFGIAPSSATAYSLFIVGGTALVGALTYARRGLLDLRTALVFAPPSFLGVYLVRRYLMPALPESLFTLGSFEVTKDRGIILLFGLLMFGTALSMIRSRSAEPERTSPEEGFRYGVIMAEGLVVGALTGLVGAGGGFLVIPALVLLAKLPMKKAVGTSLLIIAAKSLLGFVGDLQNSTAMNWPLLFGVTGIAVIGIFIGSGLGHYVPGAKLKPAFGYFVLVMGIYLVGSELLKDGSRAPAATQRNTTTTITMNNSLEITAEQLAQELRSEHPPVLLDVREADEREISHLPNDIHIPMFEVPSRMGELDKNTEIVVYCRTGNRSGRVVDMLSSNGYRVRNLVGGINGWSERVDPRVAQY